MIKNIAKKSLVLALLAGIGFGATVAQAQERVYVIDQRDVVAKSGFDLCWRTGYWTPAAAAKDPAGCQCDKDLIPAEVCNPAMRPSLLLLVLLRVARSRLARRSPSLLTHCSTSTRPFCVRLVKPSSTSWSPRLRRSSLKSSWLSVIPTVSVVMPTTRSFLKSALPL
jgi:hypothetical protein